MEVLQYHLLILPRQDQKHQKKQRVHKRTATAEHADQLFANLNAFVAEIEGDDEYIRDPSTRLAINTEKQQNLERITNMLAQAARETPQLTLPSLEEADEDGAGEVATTTANESTSKNLVKIKTEQEIEIDKQVYSRSRARNSIRFEQSVISHIGIDPKVLNEEEDSDEEEFAYNRDLLGNVEEAEEYQNFDDLEDDDREKLIEKIESLKTMLKEKDVICEQYKQAQIVMMDHLAETNEALFHFFKVRYRIPGQKTDRGTGVYEN